MNHLVVNKIYNFKQTHIKQWVLMIAINSILTIRYNTLKVVILYIVSPPNNIVNREKNTAKQCEKRATISAN